MEFILEGIDEIIENVLKHLPMVDINRFMVVNKKWYRAAKRIKSKREAITYAHYSRSRASPNRSNAYLENLLNYTSSEPKNVIAFVSGSLDQSFAPVPATSKGLRATRKRSNKKQILSLHSYFKGLWPKTCSYVELISAGIIATDWNSGRIEEHEHCKAASILMIPERHDLKIDVRISNFGDVKKGYFNDSPKNDVTDTGQKIDAEATEDGHDKDEADQSHGNRMSPLKPKLVLMFYNESRPTLPRTYCRYYECVVAGCCVDRITLGDTITKTMAITFLGGPNVHCASMILEITCKKEKDVEMKLKDFIPFLKQTFEGTQDKDLSSKSSSTSSFDTSKYGQRIMAFMLACVARGAHFYGGRTNIESGVFQKLFPGVPLLGVFGFGEVGVNILNKDNLKEWIERSDKPSYAEEDEFFNTDSTIFVMLTF